MKKELKKIFKKTNGKLKKNGDRKNENVIKH